MAVKGFLIDACEFQLTFLFLFIVSSVFREQVSPPRALNAEHIVRNA